MSVCVGVGGVIGDLTMTQHIPPTGVAIRNIPVPRVPYTTIYPEHKYFGLLASVMKGLQFNLILRICNIPILIYSDGSVLSQYAGLQ